jgi:hypothetical protein
MAASPPQASLDGPFAKLQRAKEHLQALEVEADRVMEHVVETTAFRARYNPDMPRFLVDVAEAPVVPFRVSTIAGDIIHNLRSALDLLAYQLPILASGEPWEKTQWPIVTEANDLNARRFKGLHDRLVNAGRGDIWVKVESHQAIRYVQQFPSTPTPNYDILTARYRDLPLLVLRELANQDKHRLLIEPYFNVLRYDRIQPRCIRDCKNPRAIESWGLWYTLKKDAPPVVQFAIDVTGPDPKMEVDIGFTPNAVSLGFLPGAALDWLVLIADAVRAVLEDFAPLF